jgi:hypothetical protein
MQREQVVERWSGNTAALYLPFLIALQAAGTLFQRVSRTVNSGCML